MGLNLEYDNGQTPLDQDEKVGLRIPTIATREELDEFEQQNIEEAILWLFGRSLNAHMIFTEKFVRDLHKRMFGNVWDWAGEFRKTNKNLGIDHWKAPTALKALLNDAQYWAENETYNADEIAIRFKHRIVSIHCFPNGNGRHSRLMADVIVDKIYNLPVFTWGAACLAKTDVARTNYLTAIKAADQNNYQPLLLFARS